MERPIGLRLGQVSKAVSRAFNDALVDAGGSLPLWLVLLSVKQGEQRAQIDLAQSMGIEGPTLTRHLDGFERLGYVVRRRDPADRRAVRVELTEAGERKFLELREAAIAFNRRLTAGIWPADLEHAQKTLAQLQANVDSYT